MDMSMDMAQRMREAKMRCMEEVLKQNPNLDENDAAAICERRLMGQKMGEEGESMDHAGMSEDSD